MLEDFAHNIGLILALCFVYRFIVEQWPDDRLIAKLLSGFLFGVVAVVAMTSGIHIGPGIIVDARSAVLSMGGLFGGLIVGIIAGTVACFYRLYLGGVGAPVAIASMVTVIALSLLFRRAYSDRLIAIRWSSLAAIAIAINVSSLVWFAFLPLNFVDDILGRLALPYTVSLSIGTFFLGLVFREIEKVRKFDLIHREEQERFRSLFQSATSALFEEDVSGVFRILQELRAQQVSDLRSHLERHPELIQELSRQVRVIHVNPAAIRLFRVDSERELLSEIHNLFGPGARETFIDELCAMWEGRETFTQDTTLRTKDGALIECIISIPIPRTEAAARQIPVAISDISERKRMERQIVEERRRFEEIIEATHVGTWEWSVQTGETVFNERWAEILGYTLAELAPISIETWERLTHPADLKLSDETLERVFRRELDRYECSVRMRHRDGRWIWVLDRGNVVEWSDDGKPIRMSGTHTDIHELKTLQEELEESRGELEEAQRIAKVGSWSLDVKTNAVSWSSELYRMLGLDPGSRAPDFTLHDRLFTPESWERLSQAIAQTRANGAPYELELEIAKPDGSRGWMLAKGEAVRDEAGQIVKLNGVAADITERKLSELRSQFYGRLYATLSECNAAILKCTSQDQLYSEICRIVVTSGGMKMAWIGLSDDESGLIVPVYSYGYGQEYLDGIEVALSADDPRGRGPTGTATRENRPIWFQDFANDPRTAPWRERGAKFGWRASAALPINRRGKTIGALTFYSDILGSFDDDIRDLLNRIGEQIGFALDKLETEGELLVHISALKESERRFRAMFEAAPLGIAVTDAKSGRFYDVNPMYSAITGWAKEDLLDKFWQDVTHPDDVADDLGRIEQMKVNGAPIYGIRKRYLRKDGSIVSVNKTLAPLSLTGELSDRHMVMIEDMTESDRLARALAEQQARFRALAEQSIVGIYTLDDYKLTYANPYLAKMFGYTVDEVIGRSAFDFIAAEERERVTELVRKRMMGEIDSLRYEFKGVRKDGSNLMAGVHSTTVAMGGMRVIMGVIQDITDKLRSEQEIRDYIVRIENMIVGTVDAVSKMVELRDPYTSGHERRVGELSAAIAAEMGLDQNVQRGLRLAGAVHDVGKLAIPAEMLSKPTKLTALEYEIIKGHAEQGYEMLKAIDSPWPLAEVARQHHERLDGSGYPRGLKGADILVEARILAVADVVESMSSHRPYRPALGIDKALSEIERGRGTWYDEAAVDACRRLFRDKGYEMPSAS